MIGLNVLVLNNRVSFSTGWELRIACNELIAVKLRVSWWNLGKSSQEDVRIRAMLIVSSTDIFIEEVPIGFMPIVYRADVVTEKALSTPKGVHTEGRRGSKR